MTDDPEDWATVPTQSAWLIEYPADKHHPVRYWAAGQPDAVVDPNHATRFARKDDAVAVAGAYATHCLAKPVEHRWLGSAA